MSASSEAVDGLARKMFQSDTDEPWEAASPDQDAYYQDAARIALSGNAAITAAAVEAAYSRIADNLDDTETESWKGLLRAALEAAAPHMPSMRAVAAVLALHREMECRDEDNEPVGGSYCEECKDLDDHSGERVHEVYPCMTVREITKALAGEETFTAMRDRIERTSK